MFKVIFENNNCSRIFLISIFISFLSFMLIYLLDNNNSVFLLFNTTLTLRIIYWSLNKYFLAKKFFILILIFLLVTGVDLKIISYFFY